MTPENCFSLCCMRRKFPFINSDWTLTNRETLFQDIVINSLRYAESKSLGRPMSESCFDLGLRSNGNIAGRTLQ